MASLPAPSPVATAVGDGGPDRPGWIWTIGSVLLAWVMTVVGMVVIAVALSPLSVDFSLALSKGWAWAPTDAWAVVAGASPLLLYVVLLALSLRFAVEWRSEWKLRLTPVVLATTAAMLLISGTQSEPGDPNRWWAAIVVVVMTRQFAIAPSRGPWLRSRWLVAFGIVTLVLTIATVAYRPLHPLQVQLGDEVRGGGVEWGFGQDDPRVLSFGFDNASFADARIVSATAVADGDPVVVQVGNSAATSTPATAYVALPTGGLALTPDDHADSGRIRLAPGTCRGGGAHESLVSGLVLRVETLGSMRTQRFARDNPVVLRCP